MVRGRTAKDRIRTLKGGRKKKCEQKSSKKMTGGRELVMTKKRCRKDINNGGATKETIKRIEF